MVAKDIKKVIFIITDTLRAKNLGYLGYKPSPSPNLDELSKKGAYFTNAYASITKTDPSITSIMSGKYPLSTGLIHHGRDITKVEEDGISKNKFLQEILRENGFKTAAIDWMDRWHKRGYDIYSGKIGNIYNSTTFAFEKIPLLFYLKFIDKAALKFIKRDFFIRFYYSFFKDPIIPYDPAELVVDKAIDILNSEVQKKLFLYLHFWDTHYPYTKSRGVRSYLTQGVENMYNAEVSYLDSQIGRLIEFLQSTNQLSETLIILTSDHGENFCDYGRPVNHENLYDEVVKVPLIISHPSLPAKKISQLVQHVDILPTVCRLLKLSFPKDIDGKSMVSLINGTKKNIRDFVYFEDVLYRTVDLTKKNRKRGIRVGSYKYIETLIEKGKKRYNLTPPEDTILSEQELYNLEKDPQEKNNLMLNKSQITNKLRGKLMNLLLVLNLKRLNHNPNLAEKVNKTITIIKKTIKDYGIENIAIAWKGGKDTTTMMHIIKTIYGGNIPFKVMFNDTTLEFKQTYEFIEKMKKLWNLKLVVVKHSAKELNEYHNSRDNRRKKELSRLMKISSIKNALKKYKFKGFMLGIRRDENEARANEKSFSKRQDHIRIHPMLDWTEKNIWDYIKIFGVPYLSLYDQGYRSVGEKPFTKKADKQSGERAGRDPEKERVMGQLRKMGYW